MDKDSLFQKLN